jgi:hypothetical protein
MVTPLTMSLTSDWSAAAIVDFHLACRELECKPADMACVVYAESGGYARAHNPNGDASGIFQPMPSTLKNLGFHPEMQPKDRAAAFRTLDVRAQIPAMRRYFAPHKGKLTSVANVYVVTFLPALIDRAVAGGPDYVLVDDTRSDWDHVVFTANAGFDENKDLKIEVRELDRAVWRQCRGPRWDELSARLGGVDVPEDDTISYFDLRTVIGLQRALGRLGYGIGEIDGLWGPLTRMGVVSYQGEHGLEVDGKPGPLTRASIQDSLNAAA